VLQGMEERTISSYTPRLEQLPGVPAEALQRAGHDVFSLARARPRDVADQVALFEGVEASDPEPADTRRARTWVEAARLAALRGIGTENARRLMAVGVDSVHELARSDPNWLAGEIAATGEEVPPARVRVWVRAARRGANVRA
jgi:hypothetical protein